MIAEQAAHLTAFQRTPNYSVPVWNAPLDSDLEQRIKADYQSFREQNKQTVFGADFRVNDGLAVEASPEDRLRVYEERWERGGLAFLGAFGDLLFDEEANRTAADFLREKIRGIVDEPALADTLCPDTVVGCKRLCADTEYFATYNRENVTLVDVSSDPIERITAAEVRTGGVEHSFDAIVFAIGFDAMTGPLSRIDIRGRAWVEHVNEVAASVVQLLVPGR